MFWLLGVLAQSSKASGQRESWRFWRETWLEPLLTTLPTLGFRVHGFDIRIGSFCMRRFERRIHSHRWPSVRNQRTLKQHRGSKRHIRNLNSEPYMYGSFLYGPVFFGQPTCSCKVLVQYGCSLRMLPSRDEAPLAIPETFTCFM